MTRTSRRALLSALASSSVAVAGCTARRSSVTPNGGYEPDPVPGHESETPDQVRQLVENSRTDYRIVVGESVTEEIAAIELYHYVKQSTGAELLVTARSSAPAIRFEVDSFESVRSDARADAFELRADGDDIVVRGGSARGLLYGVYELLERALGVRWFAPGPDGEVVPSTSTVEVAVGGGIHAPDFAYRVAGAFHSEAYRLWAIRNRLHIAQWPLANEQSETSRPTQYVDDRGGVIKSTNIHSFYNLLPPDEYQDEHPGWYSENQLDITNPAVQDALVDRCRDFFERYPDAEFVAVTPNDGYGWPDAASPQQHLDAQADADQPRNVKHHASVSEAYFDAVQEIATRLQATHPEKRLYASAYVNYVWPPVLIDQLPENVVVALTHYNPADYAHPIGADATDQSKTFLTVLKRWATKVDSPWFYGYTVKYAMDALPFPIAYRLATDIDTLAAHGYDGFYSQGGEDRWGQYGPHLYVMARKLWDTDQSADDLLEEYFAGLAGAGGTEAKQAYDRLADELAALQRPLDRKPMRSARYFLTDELLGELDDYYARARERAAAPRAKRNIDAMRTGVVYAPRYFRMREALSEYERTGERDALARAVDAYNEIAGLVESTSHLDALPPDLVQEDGYFTLQKYFRSYRSEIDTSGREWTVPERD